MKTIQVKIIGAGSIGNHLAQASRRMGWSVCVVDTDRKALLRMKHEMYPARYGAWDRTIRLFVSGAEPKGGFDAICIGTPPHVRLQLALEALKEKPRVLQLEKPLCAPFDRDLPKFIRAYRKQHHTIAVVGYDHAVSKSIARVAALLQGGTIGEPLTLDVEFRAHWRDIFAAHPWLSGPEDSYLGFWKKGGGASGEHSHALHLFQYLAREAGLGVWKKVAAALQVEKKGAAEYDSLASFTLTFSSGHIGRVVQDVVTSPTRKWIRVQGDAGFVEWHCNGHQSGDLVRYAGADGVVHEEVFAKKRPDDFYEEMLHIRDIMDRNIRASDSPISFESGLSVMEVLKTAWKHPNESLQPIRRM